VFGLSDNTVISTVRHDSSDRGFGSFTDCQRSDQPPLGPTNGSERVAHRPIRGVDRLVIAQVFAGNYVRSRVLPDERPIPG
jgi:hypothetical protein